MGHRCPYTLIATTQLGFEQMARTAVENLEPAARVDVSPRNYQGLLGVVSEHPESLASELLATTSFVEKVFVVHGSCEAEPARIAELSLQLARERIPPGSTFAARTVRRGKHPFTSIDVNVAVGSAIVNGLGLEVNLDNPDYVVFVNIIDECAYITIMKGEALKGKQLKRKPAIYGLFHRLIVAQEPYVSADERASYKMGVRIGRGLQNFEVGDYYVALTKPVPAAPLLRFVKGVLEGIESRYRVEEKSYGRKPVRTNVHVYEMHNLVTMLREHPLIVLEPEGQLITQVKDKLLSLLRSGKRPVLLMGSREGVPSGLFRFASLVVDVMPGVTLSSEYALPTALGAIATILAGEEVEGPGSGGG